MDLGTSIFALIKVALAQYRSPVTIIPGLLRHEVGRMLDAGLTVAQIHDFRREIERGRLNEEEKLTAVRVATYLATESAMPTHARTDLDACFIAAFQLVRVASWSVADSTLYIKHIKAMCLTAAQMYLDGIAQVRQRADHPDIRLERAHRRLNEVDSLLQGREPLWVCGVFDLLAAKSFTRHQDCSFLRPVDANRVTLMISHRWEAGNCPDPTGMQFHRAVRFAIKACMMAMHSSPAVFNAVDCSDTQLCHELYFALQELYAQQVAWWKRPNAAEEFASDSALHERFTLLHEYFRNTIGDSNTNFVLPDFAALPGMLDQIDIWYDYTSLPQHPRNERDEDLFRQGLDSIDQAFSENFTVILWSKASLNRTWCVFEALLATLKSRHNVFASENSIESSDRPAPMSHARYRPRTHLIMDETASNVLGAVDLNLETPEQRAIQDAWDAATMAQFGRKSQPVDLSQDLSSVLVPQLLALTNDLRDKDGDSILKYLQSHGYQCTNEFDIEILAEKLARHMRRIAEQRPERDK